MKPVEPAMYTDGGPWVIHNYRCPVVPNKSAVYELHTGVFQPSWYAQEQGWRIVQAKSWLQKLVLRMFFSEGVNK